MAQLPQGPIIHVTESSPKANPVTSELLKSCGYSTTLIARFWSKVDRKSDSECWPWLGAKSGDGYGTMRSAGRKVQATHVAWFLTHGQEVPIDRLVMHECDNPPCCNPGHLILGTHALNTIDAQDKGRRPRRDWWLDYPETMRAEHIAQIYNRKVGGVKKAAQQRSPKIPTPCTSHPWGWNRADVERHYSRRSA